MSMRSTWLGFVVFLFVHHAALHAESITYALDFDHPMSWADDVVFWGMGGGQIWETAKTDDGRSVLRIDTAPYGVKVTSEMRTLQFNHKPGTKAVIEFDVRSLHALPGETFRARYYDGYCTGLAIREIADEPFPKFPAPFLTTDEKPLSQDWQHIRFETPALEHTVLTLAFHLQHVRDDDHPRDAVIDLDNLKVTTTALDEFKDPGFDWHGREASTQHLRSSTYGAMLDWCDFADQETVKVDDNKEIHYTLMQFRDTATKIGMINKHNIRHEPASPNVGGRSIIALDRTSSGDASAVSWGVRQTFSYAALGITSGEKARIRVSMNMINEDAHQHRVSGVQLGVDPNGGIVTQRATWTELQKNEFISKEGWKIATLEFDRPVDATAMTVYFRHRDGQPREPCFKTHFPEPQSAGTRSGSVGMADWVMVERID